ncbi:MAG: glycerol-3-phosphate 1-O-acyltransferase PlsY [Clostridia bacterium]|nr:glycerol-3-phosphate 1-O-acyltransferase PlsY [Clostridia bacterium]
MDKTLIYNLVFLVVAYLLGSINTSIIVSKMMIGDDIRKHGSGNAGATNTLRTVGKKGAALVVLGDVLKAVIALLFAKFAPFTTANALYVAGIGAVLGHNFPLYFQFKGGKGIVVSLVAILFADPVLGLVTFVAAIAIMAVTRYVSLGSMLGAVIFAVLSLIFKAGNTDFIIFSFVLAVLAVYMHRENLARLLAGNENKLGSKKKV